MGHLSSRNAPLCCDKIVQYPSVLRQKMQSIAYMYLLKSSLHYYLVIIVVISKGPSIIVNIFTYDNSYRKRGRGFKNVDNYHNFLRPENDLDDQT